MHGGNYTKYLFELFVNPFYKLRFWSVLIDENRRVHMGLKENFHQAFRELLHGIDPGDFNNEEKVKPNPDVYSNSEIRRASAQEISEPAENDFADFATKSDDGNSNTANGVSQNLEDVSAARDESEQNVQTRQLNIFNRRAQTSRPNPYAQANPANQSADFSQSFSLTPPDTEEMTIISKNTVVVGNIHSLANVTIDGNVRGMVNVLKNANLSGALIGNLVCNNSVLHGSSVEGNMLAKSSSYIDNDSILLGDMKAQNSSIDGKIKGNIDVGSKIVLHKNAIVAGNINTDSIAIEDGANIKGFVNTAFFAEHGDSAFPSQVIIGDENQNLDDWEKK